MCLPPAAFTLEKVKWDLAFTAKRVWKESFLVPVLGSLLWDRGQVISLSQASDSPS